MNLQAVHVRVNDAATGKPTPVRLRITDAAGRYFAPFGHAAEFPVGPGEAVGGDVVVGGQRWAYIDGACEIALPPEELTIDVRKGAEYRPLQTTVHLPAGKLALRFAVERWTDPRASGWYSGDTRAHNLPPHAALLEAAAEGLTVVNLLAYQAPILASDGQSHPTYPNLAAFSGQQPCLERDCHLVVVNTHNRHPVLGRLGLLDCHRPVFPLTFGGSDATDDWSLADWCRQCHRKRGLVIWTDAFAGQVGHAGEALADAILDDVDAIEIDPTGPTRFRAWYHLLNAGIRVPLVGASAKDSNRTPLGAMRTYARLSDGHSFEWPAWVEAVKAGRTYVTSGPIVSFEVEGVGPGGVVRRRDRAAPLRVAFGASAVEPFDRVDVLADGNVVASGMGEGQHAEIPAAAWVAVRCIGGGHILAHTSPVYVECEGDPPQVDPASVEFVVSHLDRTRDWIESQGQFEKPKSRDHLVGILNAARQQLLARAGGSGTIGA